MKILIDECVPRPIKRFFGSHEAQTVQELGYSGYTNGELIALADSRFDIFITSDQNLRYQQNLQGRHLAILMLSTNDWGLIRQHEEQIAAAVDHIQFGEFVELYL